MIILNSSENDIDLILDLYEKARSYQKSRYHVIWPHFPAALVIKEIKEKKQWKLIIEGEVACVWATAYTDPEIWEEKNKDPSVYIHRIATNPVFAGNQLVKRIVLWAEKHAKQMMKNYIRLDTVGENEKLIRHYTNCGFDFLGMFVPKDLSSLPAHYHNAEVALFEKGVMYNHNETKTNISE